MSTLKEQKILEDKKRRSKKTAFQALSGILSFELVFLLLQALTPALEEWVEAGGTLDLLVSIVGGALFATLIAYGQNQYLTAKGKAL